GDALDEVEEVERIEVELELELAGGVDGGGIHLGGDARQDVEDHLVGVGLIHASSGRWSNWSIVASRRDPSWPLLARWSAASVMATTGQALTTTTTTHGRAAIRRNTIIATCGG